jgi:hypothetical protein
MLMFCMVLYLAFALPAFILIWAMLVVAKWDDTERGYDLLDDPASSFEFE